MSTKKKNERKLLRASSVILDSGGFSLFVKEVRNKAKTEFERRRLADKFYTLDKGSVFRTYVDEYVTFVKSLGYPIMFANADRIFDPEFTWEVQQYIEKTHKRKPIPIVHSESDIKWIDHYKDRGYRLVALGGFAWKGLNWEAYDWIDKVFVHVCPKSNGYKPTLRLHGFALTSYKSIMRWPWWSVDSTSWLMSSATGGVYVPRMKKGQWDFNTAPMMVDFSDKSALLRDRDEHKVERRDMTDHAFTDLEEVHDRRTDRGGADYHIITKGARHIRTCSLQVRKVCEQWLAFCGVEMKDINASIEVDGREPSYIQRSKANVTYFKMLEESRPTWPYPLDSQVRRKVSNMPCGNRGAFPQSALERESL
ncbi:MAG: hypothetical protein Unbinned3891contig1000_23 [Prokaryotic dsDNA virus sp.]|nr:MAG: hypothetical protein Unbinned3891contig1000_23 [Prokaryotic dsDNA virus sp.]|tara:strand:- start:10944 stop:12041 length:1098 start_codon:yes stop_codon:yes gene_type:complete